MKQNRITLLVIVLLCSTFVMKSFSQSGATTDLNGFGFGGGLGVAFENDLNQAKQEAFMLKSFSFTMVGSYFRDNWLLESSGTYCGALLWNLNAGYSFPLSEYLRLDLTAGINDNIMPTFDKFQVVHEFSFNSLARIQFKDGFVSCNKIN